MTEVYVNSGLQLVAALKKSKLRAGIDYWSESSGKLDGPQVKLRFKDRDTALMFKLTYGAGNV